MVGTGTFATQSTLQAGSAIVGKVGIDQTTPGTTNGVQINAALPAGTNLLGKVGLDQTTPGTTNAVAIAQIGSTTVLSGAGAVGTGAQRVAVAQDSTTVAGSASIPAGTNLMGKVGIDQTTPGTTNGVQDASTGATGSAPPSKASYLGATVGGNLTGLVACGSHAYVHVTSATDTLLVQGVTSQTVKVCGVQYHFSGSAAQSAYVENTASTNANCSSTKTQITGLVTGNSSAPSTDGFLGAFWTGLANTSGNGVCVNTSGTGGLDVDVWYTQGS